MIVQEFEKVAEFRLLPVGRVHIVKNPADCNDFKWIVGCPVKVGNSSFTVGAVECCITERPLKAGEFIGLLELL